LLILDEPTSNLDLISRKNILGVIASLVNKNSNKLSVLVSTQHIEEAEQLSNRILIINKGKDEVCNSPANIKSSYGLAMKIVCQQPPQQR
jgi:ABC-type multidrug transport system ATPase subunit